MHKDEFYEIQRLRQLVSIDADRNLSVWGAWRRGGQHVRGYPTRSTFLENIGGCASEDASDHVYEALNNWRAEVADAVISAMEYQHRVAISHVYEAGVRPSSSISIEDALIAATDTFWAKAIVKGLT
ncbi:MAG: hypothetical protein WAV01_02025 [Candidatus Saccharimonadales bacterium]